MRISHNETMKNFTPFNSFSLPVLLLLMLVSEPLFAEKIKVKKIKGTQAVIETITPLEEGQTYELITEPLSQDVDYKSSVLLSRRNSLTIGGQLDFLRSDSLSQNQLSLQARYGWNFSTLEVGVFFEATSKDQGAGATTTMLGGGYFDYNLIPNRDPKKIIYGPFVLVGIGSISYPSSTAGGSVSTLQTNFGGFFSYFVGTSTTALRGELYGTYQQVNTTAQQSALTGLGARGLLVFYF